MRSEGNTQIDGKRWVGDFPVISSAYWSKVEGLQWSRLLSKVEFHR